LVSPEQFSPSGLIFTGLRYHLTAKNALEASYSSSYDNHFAVQPTTANTLIYRPTFERYTWSVNYVRYLSARGALQPFLTAGLGPTQSISYITGWDRTNLSFNVGLGTDFRISDRLAFRLEVRDSVSYLPAPLQGTSHDLAPTAGLVFSPQTSIRSRTRFPQVEVFIEGGGSVLTGGSGPSARAFMLLSNGQSVPDPNIIRTNSFSKAGRLLAGFRVMLSNKNALEVSYSRSPNRYTMQQRLQGVSLDGAPLEQISLAVVDYNANYVRHLPWGKNLRPFVTAGAGRVEFAGLSPDVTASFGGNIGMGADVPLWNRLAARFEIRDYMSRQPDLTGGIVHNFAPTAGLAYRFK
jgi:hypothetical protein